MKMKASLITYFLLAGVVLVVSDQITDTDTPSAKRLGKLKISNADSTVNDEIATSQRRRDSGYYFQISNRYRLNHNNFGRHNNHGRIVNNLQNKINRPFKHYGPPSQQDSSFKNDHSQLISSNPVTNQEAPNRIRDNHFIEESAISSQNDQPFGQHTANYLPPKNQKLPNNYPVHLFSNQNYNINKHLNQQQQPGEFNVHNPDVTHNAFTNQQISDAALFLSQNAQAISELYGAPAINENYAPNNQYIDQQKQQNIPNLNLQINNGDQSQDFLNQLSKYTSDGLNSQTTLDKIQSLEKDRIITQLQQELVHRENSARYTENINSQDHLSLVSPQYPSAAISPSFVSGKPSVFQQNSPFIPSTSINTLKYHGLYGPTTPATVSIPPVSPTASTISTTTLQPNQGTLSVSETGTNSLTSATLGNNPILVGSIPQYNGFVPSVFSNTNLINSASVHGAAFVPTSGSESSGNSPTYINIPLPSLNGHESAHSPSTITSISEKAPSPSHKPTITIPLGSVRPAFPVQPVQPSQPVGTFFQPTFLRPNPVPAIPATAQVHPGYGLNPALLNPSGFVYKPLKVQPIYSYYYPHISYQSTYKAIKSSETNPWSYAPYYPQTTS